MEQPINILIVDDEPKNLTVLETVLADPSYRLIRAESAEQALLALVADEFALLILDVQMPGMTGFELAQMIKDRKKTALVPIIFLTAYYNEDQHVLEGYGSGAVDYLHKPINSAVLRSKVAVFTDLHRKNRQIAVTNRALLSEIGERTRAVAELRALNESLDRRVAERTAALAASEDRLARAQRAANVGTWDWDLHTGLSSWTNEAWALFGREPSDGPIDYDLWLSCVHPDDRVAAAEACASALHGSKYNDEYRVLHRNGEIHWLRSTGDVIRQDGRAVRMIGTVHNITQRKQHEEALRDADRRKDEFLAILAHELRNPMAAISGAVELLKIIDKNPELLTEIGEMLHRQTRQMNRLVDDLLDVSRISRGKIELQQKRVDLSEIMDHAVEAVRPLCISMGHELVVQQPAEPIYIFGDSARLIQVFGNLLNNACKFTNRGGSIELSASLIAEDAVVRISDNGIGIAPKQLAAIFGLFSQADTSLHRPQAGLGIGLSLVKSLTEMHGGSVEALSHGVGSGSEFIIRLPLMPDSESALHSSVPAWDTASSNEKRRVLIVDDNIDAALCLATLLKVEGHETFMAHDGEEAVEKVLSHEPDIILLDLGLPKVDGYEVCRRIRERLTPKRPLIVALTGWAQAHDRARTKATGFDAHLVKPVELSHLMKLLDDIQSSSSLT